MAQYPSTSKTLLERLKSGDDVPWQEFYDKYHGIIEVTGHCSGLTDTEVQELVQNVMQQFFLNQKTFIFKPEIARFRTYFGTIIRSQIAILFRARKKSLIPEGYVPGSESDDEPGKGMDEVFREKWKEIVWTDALEHLKSQVQPKTYLAFTMTSRQNKSAAETAAFLKMNVNAVYAARNRCIGILKEYVAGCDPEDRFDVPDR